MGQKPTTKWIVTKILTITLFWTITLVVLLYTSGVRVNWQSGRVSSSVSISLRTQARNKQVVKYILNGNEINGELPLVISQLQPGHYTLTLQRTGAVDWQHSVYLAAGQAELFHDIVFIPQSINQRDPTTTERRLVNAKKELIDEDLVVRNNELYRTDHVDEELIVRMSETIDQAFWFPKRTHIIVKTGTTVSLLEVNGGTNRTKLLTLPLANPIKIITPDETTVVVQQGENVMVYDLTLP